MTSIYSFDPGLVLLQAVFLQPPFTSNPHDKVEPGQQVPEQWTAVPGMSATVSAELIEVTGHVGFQIEDERCALDDKFMLGVALSVDGSLVRAPIGTQATTNEIRDTHYHDFAFSWTMPVEPGPHQIEIQARAVPKRGAQDAGSKCHVFFKERHYSGATIKVYGRGSA